MSIGSNFTLVKLEEIFLCKYGKSKYTKSYCNQHKGEYEVFTGTTIGSFAFINSYDYCKPTLTFSTDGENAGTLSLITNEKYSIGGHRAILKKKDEKAKIDLQYCYYCLKDKLFCRVKKGSVPSVRWNSIKDIKIKIPIDDKEEYNLEEQERMSSIYDEIEQKKDILRNKIIQTNNLLIEVEENNNIKYMPKTLKEIIDFEKSITNNSKFTKAYINKNKGNIPVYGASMLENKVGYGYIKDNLKGVNYFENCLTWNIDGSCAIFYRLGRFSLSEKVIPLILFDEYKDTIDLNYLRYAIMRSKQFGEFNFLNKAGKEKLKQITINIPIDCTGKIDIDKQKEIVDKNIQIEEIKRNIIEKIKNILSMQIAF